MSSEIVTELSTCFLPLHPHVSPRQLRADRLGGLALLHPSRLLLRLPRRPPRVVWGLVDSVRMSVPCS